MTIQKRQNPTVLNGFDRAPTERIHRLIISLTADWKKGKTTFALTAPAPIALIDMDTGLEGVIEKWAEQKEIHVKSFNYHDATSEDEWTKMWEDCKQAFLGALNNPRIKTVVWDTATEAFELIRMARFGKLNKVVMAGGKAVPYPWGPVNTEFRDLLRKSLGTRKNVIFIHKTKDEYRDDARTGNKVRAGFGDMEFVTQVNILLWKDVEKGGYGLTIEDCRQNSDVSGLELVDPLNTFINVASLIFPESEEEEWQ